MIIHRSSWQKREPAAIIANLSALNKGGLPVAPPRCFKIPLRQLYDESAEFTTHQIPIGLGRTDVDPVLGRAQESDQRAEYPERRQDLLA